LLVEAVDHVRIAHEALLRYWPRARQRPALQPEALRIGRVLAPRAAAWSASRSDEDLVVAPAMLAAATELIKAHPGALDATIEGFIEAAQRALAMQRETAPHQFPPSRHRQLAHPLHWRVMARCPSITSRHCWLERVTEAAFVSIIRTREVLDIADLIQRV
jgi:hypothetical protein